MLILVLYSFFSADDDVANQLAISGGIFLTHLAPVHADYYTMIIQYHVYLFLFLSRFKFSTSTRTSPVL